MSTSTPLSLENYFGFSIAQGLRRPLTVLGLLWSSIIGCSPAISLPPRPVQSRVIFDSSPMPKRIAFGSCLHQNHPQEILNAVAQKKAESFIFLGDTVYADIPGNAKASIDSLREAYSTLKQSATFRQAFDQALLIGTWDDHDYGLNDGGIEFPLKADSQQLFLDFYGFEANHPLRSGEGIYHVYERDPVAERLQIIVLDTRYFRTSLRIDPNQQPGALPRFLPSDSFGASVLGDAQWDWLYAMLKRPARYRLLISSIQVLHNTHRFEHWGNFPKERQRLLDALSSSDEQALIIISGDRHHAEISMLDIGTKHLVDVTSSALNLPRKHDDETNPFRVGAPFYGANFGLLELPLTKSDPLRISIVDAHGTPRLQREIETKN